ncbi:CAP domain-containing protein [Microvirga sp. W0021]|uniref:CAP domain-containing protein n=1 Tax=Hohaiivirga grylli TaxID=3133970 RepID=A0ABV0BPD1_9HYPH
MRKLIVTCALAGLALTLAACDNDAKKSRPSFYVSLASASAQIDSKMASNMISAYRRNHGLGPLVLDPALQAAAEQEARAMAGSDKPTSADTIKQRLARSGTAKAEVNTSAGYHTLAEAFSGWRDSPQHNRVMLNASMKRMGIATAYAPGSKYKVYWVLIEAP